MRNTKFENGEYYHIYNRGVDKRGVFMDVADIARFLQSMEEFNTIDPIGSIYENSFKNKTLGGSTTKLVSIVAFCLVSNHYHLILKELTDKGIEKFMHKIGTGYTRYFNEKTKRSGSLFQGRYKSVWVDSNEYLLYLSVYVNLNDKIHSLGGSTTKSSWGEYTGEVVDGIEMSSNFYNSNILDTRPSDLFLSP